MSSSSNEPISNASAALTSPRGGIRGAGISAHTPAASRGPQRMDVLLLHRIYKKNGNLVVNPRKFRFDKKRLQSSTYPLPQQPILLSVSLTRSRSRRSRNSGENESGSSTFCMNYYKEFCYSYITSGKWRFDKKIQNGNTHVFLDEWW